MDVGVADVDMGRGPTRSPGSTHPASPSRRVKSHNYLRYLYPYTGTQHLGCVTVGGGGPLWAMAAAVGDQRPADATRSGIALRLSYRNPNTYMSLLGRQGGREAKYK